MNKTQSKLYEYGEGDHMASKKCMYINNKIHILYMNIFSF